MYEASMEIIGTGICYLSPLFPTEHNKSMYVQEWNNGYRPSSNLYRDWYSFPSLSGVTNKSDIILSPYGNIEITKNTFCLFTFDKIRTRL